MIEERGERSWRPERFIGTLEQQVKLARDPESRPGRAAARAALAALRRGLGHGPGEVPEVDRVLQRWLDRASDHEERLAYVIGPLIALQAQGGSTAALEEHRPRDLGASLAEFQRRQEAKRASARQADESGQDDRIDPIERRLLALLASHSNGLSDQLRGVVTLLKTEDVGIDWQQLWYDLWRWDDPERPVQRDWARSLWRSDPAVQRVGAFDDNRAAKEEDDIDLDEEDEDDEA